MEDTDWRHSSCPVTLATVLILVVGVFMLAIFELRYQRDRYKVLWCIEVIKTDPDHSVCGELQ